MRDAVRAAARAGAKRPPRLTMPTALMRPLVPIGPLVGRVTGYAPNLRELDLGLRRRHVLGPRRQGAQRARLRPARDRRRVRRRLRSVVWAHRHDLLRPRRSRARMPSGRGARRLRARRDRARRRRRSSTTAPSAATGRCGSGSPSATASTPAASCSRTARSRASSSSRNSSRARPAASSSRRPRTTARSRSCARSAPRSTPCRMDDEGLDLDALERALATGRRAGVPLHDPDVPEPERPHALRRAPPRVAELARRHGVLVFEDDPYGLVRFEGEPPPSSSSLPAASACLHLVVLEDDRARDSASATSILPRELARVERRAATLHHAALLGQATVLRVRQARPLRAEPRARPRPAARAARRDARRARARVPPSARWSRPEGGYFLWLELPAGDSAS